jgi:hypothetical protein
MGRKWHDGGIGAGDEENSDIATDSVGHQHQNEIAGANKEWTHLPRMMIKPKTLGGTVISCPT